MLSFLKNQKCTDNKGFSLVELLVSFAILAISSVAIIGLMSTGMRFFGRVSDTTGLQYEYQTVMTQVREYLNDCNAGVVWDDTNKALYIVEREHRSIGTGQYNFTTHVFYYDSTGNGLYYIRAPEDTADRPADVTLTGGSRVSERINGADGFAAALTNVAGNERVSSVTLSMGFVSRTRTYSSSQTIALRNFVETADSYSDLRYKLRNT